MTPPPLTLPADASAPVTGSVKRRSLGRLVWDAAKMFLFGFPLYGVLALAAHLLVLVTFLPLGTEARKRYARQVIYRGMAFWAHMMEAVGILRIDFEGTEKLRSLRGVVIAPNHPTLLDATLFLARVPQITCLMKRSILSNPFMGGLTRFAGYLRNDHGPAFIRQGRDALRSGENLLIFPEGTRTVQPPINPFKKGFALIATLAEAPIQTVFIDTPLFFLGKRWPLWRIPVLPVCYTVRPGRVFPPVAGRTAKALGDELEAYFRSELTAADGGVSRKAEAGK